MRKAGAVRRGRIILPGPLGLTPSFPFVGRSHELAQLRSLLALAEDEGSRVVLLGGEPGSGKTRLVREFAHEAAAGGALVLYGAADAVVNTPYQPFVESLAFLVRTLDPEALSECVGAGGGELGRLLPDLSARLGPLPTPAKADPDTERHRLHTAVADLLAGVGRAQPLLLVVDDAHWADAPSLHLFRHLVRTGADARILLLATFRDPEADVRSEFEDALADLTRAEGVTRSRLGALSGDDVAEFVRRSTGTDAGGELGTLARSIEELTGGNPFLLCELWRTLVESGVVEVAYGTITLTQPVGELASPESVRNVIDHRLGRLAPCTTALLEVAAVIGHEFELEVLGPAAGLDEPTLASSLEEAVRSGTIDEVPGPGLTHRFTHELVRRALYDRLTGVRRAELHLRVGEALERAHAGAPERALPELAHHFAIAAPVGGIERAVRYNVRAADAAMASLAFEEAANRLTTALELGIHDEGERTRLELELGTAHRKAGQTLEALSAFAAAAALARSRGDGEALARAALGFEEACWAPAVTDQAAVDLLREAIAELGEGDSTVRARVLGALSRALVHIGRAEEAGEVRTRAIEMARRLGDPQTLATVLIHVYWARATVPLEEVLDMLTEAKHIGAELGDAEILAVASSWRVVTLAGLCDLAESRQEQRTLRRLAERTRQPLLVHVAELFGSSLALCDGRLADAEELAERSRKWGQLPSVWNPSAGYGIQLFGIRREQGRLAELRPTVAQLTEGDDGASAWRPGLVALLAELGMADRVRAELARMRFEGLPGVAHDALWLGSLTYLTDACAAVGDREIAPVLYRELETFAGGNVLIGQLVACYGAVDRYLGMLAAVLGKWEAAEAHFEYALYLNRRMAAHTWTAHTAYQYGRMLLSRNRPRDRDRALELLAEAARSSERFGLVALGVKTRGLGKLQPAPYEYPDGLSAREAEVLRLVARGYSNRDIGSELHISEHTAANHIRSILRKSGCANRTDAASYAHRHGLVESGSR